MFNQDDSIDEENHEENEGYSEKTQEFVKELNCEYDEDIFSSDDSLFDRLEAIEYPHYMAKRAEDLDDEYSVPKNGLSKLEELDLYMKTLQQKTNSKGVTFNVSEPKTVGAKGLPDPSKLSQQLPSGVGNKVSNIQATTNLQDDQKQPKLSNLNMTSDVAATLTRSHDPEQEEDSLEELVKQQDQQAPIKINYARQHGTSNFISDLANRKHNIDELITYLYLFQECGSIVEHHKHKKLNQSSETRSALSEIYTEFGYSFITTGRKDTTDVFAMIEQDIKPKNLEYTVKVRSQFGVLSNFVVKLVNDWTNNRKRISIIVCDTEKGSDAYYLLVSGDENHMRPILQLGKKNKNQYKMLVSKYKAEGYKQIVIARKKLDADEVQYYMNSFVSTLKSSRDQLLNLEKLANEIETNLQFVGMIGVIDEVRPEA